jgi:hypothetical protein
MAKSMPSENVKTHEKSFLKCVQEAVLESGSETDWIWIRNGLYPDPERIVSGFGTDCIRIRNGLDPDPMGPLDPDLQAQWVPQNEKIFYF